MKKNLLLSVCFGLLIGCTNPFSDFNPTNRAQSKDQSQDVMDELMCYTLDRMLNCYSITGWFTSVRSGACFTNLFIGLTTYSEDVLSKWNLSKEDVREKIQTLENKGYNIQDQLQETCNEIENDDERVQCKIDQIHQIKKDISC